MKTSVRFAFLYALVLVTSLQHAAAQGPLAPPPGAPGPTMKTLQEIYDRQLESYEVLSAFASPSLLSATTTVMNAGYYEATDLTIVEENLAASNIVSEVVVFGVTGAYRGVRNAYVPQTGQTNSFAANDDGALQFGVVRPDPRFTDHGDGTVTDNMTGLIWLRHANVPVSAAPWDIAFSRVSSLNATGTMGGRPAGDTSNAGSHQADWRVPNARELVSLVDYGQPGRALPAGHPFINVAGAPYWTSTTITNMTSSALSVNMANGHLRDRPKTGTGSSHYIWPVRGGPE